MWMRRTFATVMAAALPLSSWADSDFQGVIGSRLLNDRQPMANGDLYLGFVNGTAATLRVTPIDPKPPGVGFDLVDMPQSIPPYSSPQLSNGGSDYQVQHPLLWATGLAFAQFPQQSQGHLRYHLSMQGTWSKYKTWKVDDQAFETFRITPEGSGVGPDSSMNLTLHHGPSPFGGFNYPALVTAAASSTTTTLTVLGYKFAMLRQMSLAHGGAYEWELAKTVIRENPWEIVRNGLWSSFIEFGVPLLLGEAAVWSLLSASGVTTLVYTTNATARLDSPGARQLETFALRQTVRSADGRFEYTLATLTLPYAFGDASYNVPDPNDGLIVLGVRRVMSAEASCKELQIDPSDPRFRMLRGSCEANAKPDQIDFYDTALDLNLCTAGGDVYNDRGKLRCEPRFTGPFQDYFHMYDGNLDGAYVFADNQLRVYQTWPGYQRTLASLPNPDQCEPGSIRYSVTQRDMRQTHQLTCTYR